MIDRLRSNLFQIPCITNYKYFVVLGAEKEGKKVWFSFGPSISAVGC